MCGCRPGASVAKTAAGGPIGSHQPQNTHTINRVTASAVSGPMMPNSPLMYFPSEAVEPHKHDGEDRQGNQGDDAGVHCGRLHRPGARRLAQPGSPRSLAKGSATPSGGVRPVARSGFQLCRRSSKPPRLRYTPASPSRLSDGGEAANAGREVLAPMRSLGARGSAPGLWRVPTDDREER